VEGAPNNSIRPSTVDVENALFTALTANGGNGETVEINAAAMLGLSRVGSVGSDASLLITNLTTLPDSGIYADRRETSEMTVRMDHSGNASAFNAENESDLTVLFDQNYLRPGSTQTSVATFYLLDQDAALENRPPLARIDRDAIRFTLEGAEGEQVLEVDDLEALTDRTHEGFLAALQADLAAKQANGTLPETLSLTLDRENTFPATLQDGSIENVPAITLTSTDGGLEAIGFRVVPDLVGDFNVIGRRGDPINDETSQIEVQVELLKAGRGSDGGDLTIGGMSNTADNVWAAGSGSRGIEVFNVTVEGDFSQPSDLASLQSTNNSLEVVNVVSAAGSLAALTIGNTNTEGAVPNAAGANALDLSSQMNNALKDVRIFNAGSFNNGATVHAHVSDESVQKYMNRVDTDADPAADNEENSDFAYSFGSGNDRLNLNISKANLEDTGSTNREDFSLAATMGAGNDTVEIQIGDGVGVIGDDWYINMKITNNLTIDGGDGNDTIRTFGSSAWAIEAGAGNDRVYTDNSGTQANIDFNAGRAAWVINTANQQAPVHEARDVNDLESAAAVATLEDIANLQLVVNFYGITQVVDVGGTDDARGGNVNDLIINQAIKEAIQNNFHLSGLIQAEDGPGRTLVITSLVDGVKADAGFSVQLRSIEPPSTAQTANNLAQLSDAQATALGFAPAVNGVHAPLVGGRFDARLANEDGQTITGAFSPNANANSVVSGTGVDLIVLSTNPTDTEQVTLTADNVVDVIFNVTNATITGVELGDIIVTSTGSVFTGQTGTFTFEEAVAVVVPPAGGGGGGAGTAVAVTGAGNVDAAGADFAYAFTAGTYTYEIANFAAGDTLDFPDAVAATVSNTSFTDGAVTVQWASGGEIITVNLTGIALENEVALSSVAGFNALFGAGTIA
jgi:hypothetical protein